MSESTPIVNSKETAGYFDIRDEEDFKHQDLSYHARSNDMRQSDVIKSCQDWKEGHYRENEAILIETSSKDRREMSDSPDSLKKKSQKKSQKGKSNMEKLTNLSPTKLKTSALLPVLRQNSSTKSPLTCKSLQGSQSARKQNGPKLFKGMSVNPAANFNNQLTLNTDVRDTYLHSEKPPLTGQNSVLANFELIREVDENKQDVIDKKQRLRDLEEEIVAISEKMLNYQNETNEIIEELQTRIVEREEVNSKIREEPIFYVSDSNLDVKPQDDYTSSDELLHLMRYDIDKKFKGFLDN
jgi:hypothetical protein